MLHVTTVRHLRDHVLWLRFNDGSEGEVDLSAELDGPVFEPLRDLALFSKVGVRQNREWAETADALADELLGGT